MNFKLKEIGFVIILVLPILETGCKPKTSDRTSQDQEIAKTGYKVYAHQAPFYILVSEKYPENQSMLLASDSKSSKSRRITFRFDDEDADPVNPLRRANLSSFGQVGSNIDASIVLSTNSEPQELDLLLSSPGQPKQYLRDLNLDGTWDIKYAVATNEQFIFLNSQWVQANKIHGHWPNLEAELAQGTFIFDMKKGQWIPKE